METFVDYYELLHVQPTAPAAVIKASYRTMLQKLNHHPDRGGDVAFAQLLNQAAETLCKPDTRKRYDALRQQYYADSHQNSAEFSWGEPGGSPGAACADQPDAQTGTRDDHNDSNEQSDGLAADALHALPGREHCLFCLAPEPAASRTTAFAYSHKARCHSCNGARTPIEQVPSASNEELRRMHRQLHASDVHLWTEWPEHTVQHCRLSDFSPVGCALSNSGPLSIEQVVMIETPLFNAICKVRRCDRTEGKNYTIGLSFITLDMQAAPGSLLDATA